MIMPPGAFFMLAIIIWISKNMIDDESEETGGAKAQ
jgi:Na+-transporting NADH:ubiquinone oxidoreductase subunit NqrD